MHGLKKIFALVAILAVFMLARGDAADVESNSRLFDRAQLQKHVGTAAVNTASVTWTAYHSLVTIAPDQVHSLYNARIVIDLDHASDGWAANGGSATITFGVARMIDGTHWRVAKTSETTAIAGSSSSGYSMEFSLGEVGPTEQVAIYAKVSSATGLAITNFPYLLYYRGGVPATLTLAN